MRENQTMRLPRLEKFFGQWTSWVAHHRLWVLLAYLPILAGCIYLSATRLGINTDTTDMISDRLSFHKAWKDYKNEFPQLADTIIVRVHSEDSQETNQAADWLERSISKNPTEFESVIRLNGGEFFKNHALLFLEKDDLKNKLSDFRPLLPLLQNFQKQPTADGFFRLLPYIARNPESSVFFNDLQESLKSSEKKINFEKYFADSQSSKTQYLEIKPKLNFDALLPAEAAILKLDEIRASYHGSSEIQVTGAAALSYEELKSVSEGAGISGGLSFLLVAFILFFALRNFNLIGLTLTNLVVGLVMTAGFAALAVGHLNMISIAFAVLFIGLGVDFSVHLCLRYREAVFEGMESAQALLVSMKQVGSSLVLCSLTTAAGFYAFIPTDYLGVSELGLISGTGMFVNLIVHVTLFPALLSFFPIRKSTELKELSGSVGGFISDFAYRHASAVRWVAGLSFVLMTPALFYIDFDSNPLNLQNQNTEAFKTYRQLMKESETSPWTIKVVTKSQEEESDLVQRLEALPEVSMVLHLDSLVPDEQKEKLSLLEGYSLKELDNEIIDYSLNTAVKKRSVDGLRAIASQSKDKTQKEALLRFSEFLAKTELTENQIQPVLERARLFYSDMWSAFSPSQINQENLPEEWRQRFISKNGFRKIEVFPTKDLMSIEAMREFSEAVLKIAPQATDDPVTLPLSGDAVVRSFLVAAFIAFFLIVGLVIFMTRSIKDSFLVLVPIFYSSVLLKAIMLMLGMSFNFPNIVVLPLLLGIGVDSGVHIIHRFRSGGALSGSTQRAVFFSALTTICSFGTLSISTHRGTASMGLLLTIGTIVVMLATLIILPALLKRPEVQQARKAA